MADNFFTGSKENLKRWAGHPNFELIRHGKVYLNSSATPLNFNVDLRRLYYLLKDFEDCVKLVCVRDSFVEQFVSLPNFYEIFESG